MTTMTADLLPKLGIDAANDTATAHAEAQPRTPNAIEMVFSRHHPAVMSDARTPFEDANDAFKRLRDDNWVLIEELRTTTAERDSLRKINAVLQTEKSALEEKYRATAAQLGAIMQGLRSAGDTILAVLRQSMVAAGTEPGLAAFVPNGVGEKIATE